MFTLEDYFILWIERYQGRRSAIRESTRNEYRRDMRRYILPALGHKPLEKLTRPVLRAFIMDLEKRTDNAYLADRTIRRIVAPLSTLLADAADDGTIPYNPCRELRFIKRDRLHRFEDGDDPITPGKARVFTRDQLGLVLDQAPENYRTLFDLLAATGLRISEILALRWLDLTLDPGQPGVVHVRRALVKGTFGPPKSEHGEREIPISRELVHALDLHWDQMPFHAGPDLVFSARGGVPLRQENVRRRVLIPMVQAAGVPWAGFHTFRHTCASILLSQGRNVLQVSRWLGHHSPAFTLTVYAHLMDEGVGGPLDVRQNHRSPNGSTSARSPGWHYSQT